MKISKNELKKGMKVRTVWKGKVYEGVILNEPKKDAEIQARLTKGRFIAITIYNEQSGKTLLMPYTNRAIYEILS